MAVEDGGCSLEASSVRRTRKGLIQGGGGGTPEDQSMIRGRETASQEGTTQTLLSTCLHTLLPPSIYGYTHLTRHGERSGRREWAMEREEGGRERWQRSDRPRRREGYRESESGRSNHRERKEDRNTSDGSWGTPAENGKEWEGDSTTPSNATTVQNNRPLPKTNWSDIDEDEDSRGTALQKDGAERVHSGSAAVSAQPEKERGDSHNMTNGGDAKPGSRSLFSVQSGSGGGSKAHQTKVFSLSQESKLVVKSDEKGKESTSSRVRGRGRGWRERLGPPQVGASRQSPSQAGSGVTVIEPLEKRLVQDQTESATEGSTFGSPGLPLGAKMESLQHQQDRTDISQEEGEGKSEDSVPPPPVVMQASLMQASKPKRYSSQRQKSGQSGEQQLEPQQWRQQPGTDSGSSFLSLPEEVGHGSCPFWVAQSVCVWISAT